MTDEALRLIIIDDSSNDAEAVSNLLRNAGQAVRAEHVEEADDLRAALASQTWDLILTKPKVGAFSALDAVRVVKQLEQDVPLILLTVNDNPDVEALLEAGARDAIPVTQTRRLAHAIAREFGDLRDRRTLRECSRRLRQTEQRARVLVDSSRDAIAYVHEGIHLYANESYAGMFGYTDPRELLDMPIMDLIAPEDHGKLKEFLRGHLKGKAQTGTFELQGMRADATTFSLVMEFSPASFEDEESTQIIIRDRSNNAELEKKLDELSRLDLATGLYNRNYFVAQLEKGLAEGRRGGAIFLIEPAEFQRLQEEVGIAAADNVVSEIAELLKGSLKEEGSLLARFGNHTFACSLPNLGGEQTEAVARGMASAIHERIFSAGARSLNINAHVGVVMLDGATKEVNELLLRAERALVDARRSGRAVQVFAPVTGEMNDSERMSAWARQIKQALRENSFLLLFQPIVSLRGEAGENYEVLLRMLGEQQQQFPPIEFLGAAENAGLMRGVDRWVLANAAKTLAKSRRAGQNTQLFIKLSNASLVDPGFLPWIGELVRAASLGAGALTIELSEEVARRHLNELRALSNGLKQFGVRLALDHVTPAGNWTNVLRHCEPDFLKLNGELIRDIADNREHQEMVRQVADLARERGALTIAQFVENANTLRYLWTSNVDYAQGYFLHEPSPNLNYDFSFGG